MLARLLRGGRLDRAGPADSRMSWLSRFRRLARPPRTAPPPEHTTASAKGVREEHGERAAKARGEIRALLAGAAYQDAARAADRALDIDPDDAELNVLAGEAQAALGEDEAALDFFQLAQHHEPANETALEGRVRALARLGRAADVPAAYREYLESVPAHRGALYALALDAHENGHYPDAVALLERLLASHPDDVDALNLLGLLHARELADFQRAEDLLRRALALAPGNSDATANLGWALAESGRYAEGLALLDGVLAVQPGDAEVRIMRALIELKRGNYARGWQDYRARLATGLFDRREYRYPAWEDQSLSGKRVLVYAEQGLGDQIMFASCLPDLLAEVAGCVLDCSPRLVGLFARSFPEVTVLATPQSQAAPEPGGIVDPIDFQLPIGELGRRFRATPEAFPARPRFLRADPDRAARYRSRLDALGTGLKVGLSWRGGSGKTRGAARSLDLAALSAALDGVPAHWISLQYAATDQEIAAARAVGFIVHHWQHAIADYEETAALVEGLDVVVSVCTSVVHLAGALGRPTLVMVPAVADWRFGDQGERMPWHPTARLLRQSRQGDWGPVLDSVRAALAGERSGWATASPSA